MRAIAPGGSFRRGFGKIEPQVVVATVNGRAYFDFVQLLDGLELRFFSRLPWEIVEKETLLLLTTSQELKEGYRGDRLLHEEMTGNRVLDSSMVMARLLKSRRDTLVVGIDPGDNTGIACLYRGYNLFATTCDSLDRTVDLVCGVLEVESADKLLRIGRGDRSKALYLANEIRRRCAGTYRIELVDERGTTKAMRAPIHRHGRRDALSALIIARKRGLEFS
ncbi:MAG: hypothetical protein ABSG92_05135 [Conexivisphaerales archaeon]|jgi:hypothetical protein